MSAHFRTFFICWLFSACLLLQALPAQSQCALGQTPGSAFPICGTATLQMATVPACAGRSMPVPGCSGDDADYADLNAFWYKFTCYSAGTLGFTIKPLNPLDDYDWQLFDITGQSPDAVYTNSSLTVTGNWAGTYGNTGAGAGGLTYIGCASDPITMDETFSAMPNLIEGHQYLLMVSHFTVTNQSGYELTFSGGTADITERSVPHLQEKDYSCNTHTIGIKLSKPVKCSSLASDGSDFSINSSSVTITGARGVNCNNGFDMDSIYLQLSSHLTPGNYTVISKTGSDGNTLLDYCDKSLPEGETLSFDVFSPDPVYVDGVVPPPCGPNQLQISFTLPIDCNSIAANGSEFTLSGPMSASVIKAEASCVTNNANNLITITLDKRLTVAGTYTVFIKAGTDGNTLASKCGAYIADNSSVSFVIEPQSPALLKAVLPVGCRTRRIRFAVNKSIQCSSIALDGSDFVVTGPTPVTITGASYGCVDNTTDTIELFFANPILLKDVYTLSVKQGSDGNSLLTPCWQETPAGNNIQFTTVDTVSAIFTYDLFLHCDYDTVALKHDGAHGVNSWRWFYEKQDSSHRQNPLKIYTQFGIKTIKLIVSNGICSDTVSQDINLINLLEAAFSVQSDTLCPDDVGIFTNLSKGNITGSFWSFDNGFTSTAFTPPPQRYALPVSRTRLHTVKLIVQSNMNCYDTAIHTLKVFNSCLLLVPTAFTPNGDGLNDYLYPLNGFKALNMEFRVFNRLGQMVFSTTDWTKKWDGRYKGDPQPAGTFVWEFIYTDDDTGERIYQKGTSVLIR